MALKSVIEHVEDLSEDLRQHYRETTIAGKPAFVLVLEGVQEHPDVLNLKSAHERQKATNKGLTTELAATKARLEGLPDDFNAEEYERLRAFHAEHEGDDPGKNKEAVQRLQTIHDQRVASLQTKHVNELKDRDKLIEKKDATIKTMLTDGGLTKALVDAGVSKEYIRAAKALLKESVEVEEEEGEYNAIVKTDAGPVDLAKFVSEWVQGDEGKVFVAKPTGADANGSNGRRLGENPWDTQGGKVKPNLTKQQELISANPEKARQLAKAAGVSPAW